LRGASRRRSADRTVVGQLNPRAARRLGNTREVAKTHYIDIPETMSDNRAVLKAWAHGDQAKKSRARVGPRAIVGVAQGLYPEGAGFQRGGMVES